MWTALKESRRKRADARRAYKFRKLRIEALETRALLTGTFNWSQAAGQLDDWDNPLNWTPVPATAAKLAGPPTAGDDLKFTSGFDPVAANVGGSAKSITVANCTASLGMQAPINVAGRLNVTSGSLWVVSSQTAVPPGTSRYMAALTANQITLGDTAGTQSNKLNSTVEVGVNAPPDASARALIESTSSNSNQPFVVGSAADAPAQLTIGGYGAVAFYNMTVGDFPGSNGTVTVSAAATGAAKSGPVQPFPSLLSAVPGTPKIVANMIVGNNGTGALDILSGRGSGGGVSRGPSIGGLTIAAGAGGKGTVTMNEDDSLTVNGPFRSDRAP